MLPVCMKFTVQGENQVAIIEWELRSRMLYLSQDSHQELTVYFHVNEVRGLEVFIVFYTRRCANKIHFFEI